MTAPGVLTVPDWGVVPKMVLKARHEWEMLSQADTVPRGSRLRPLRLIRLRVCVLLLVLVRARLRACTCMRIPACMYLHARTCMLVRTCACEGMHAPASEYMRVRALIALGHRRGPSVPDATRTVALVTCVCVCVRACVRV